MSSKGVSGGQLIDVLDTVCTYEHDPEQDGGLDMVVLSTNKTGQVQQVAVPALEVFARRRAHLLRMGASGCQSITSKSKGASSDRQASGIMPRDSSCELLLQSSIW